MLYRFARRTVDLPDGIDQERSFEADGYMAALQLASDYWFHGDRVSDFMTDNNGVITLLSSSRHANVIGTLMER
jgi:hypothetical protein